MTLYIYTYADKTFYKYGRLLVMECENGDLITSDWTNGDDRIKIPDFAPSDYLNV